MSIRQRIEDAVILDSVGRKEGALLSALAAAVATARLRYPEGTKSRWRQGKTMGEDEAFLTFFSEDSEIIYGKGRRLSMPAPRLDPEDPSATASSLTHPGALYKYLRTDLAPVGKKPPAVEFVKPFGEKLQASFIAMENKFAFSD